MAKNASTPVKAGETPTKVEPKVSFAAAMDAATLKLDALLRGGVDCITYIASAFLLGYLSRASDKVKLSVMRDEFALALNKKGLGGTQTKKYLDYAFKMAGEMHKECKYGMEVAALIAATTPDKAHDAVKAWLNRHTASKKTEHGFALKDAATRLNVLGVFLKFEEDPNKPEALPGQTEDQAAATKRQKARQSAGKRIEKDPEILKSVPTTTLVDTISKVTTFDVIIVRHIQHETKVDSLKAERAKVIAAYDARIAELGQSLGKGKSKGKKVTGEKIKKAA